MTTTKQPATHRCRVCNRHVGPDDVTNIPGAYHGGDQCPCGEIENFEPLPVAPEPPSRLAALESAVDDAEGALTDALLGTVDGFARLSPAYAKSVLAKLKAAKTL